MCDSWKLVTNDSKVGANQTFGRYWKRIHDQFHETKKFGEYCKVHMDRNAGAMSHRLTHIQDKCNAFHGAL